MRSLSSDVLAALASSTGEEVFLISVDYSGGTIYMCTGARNLYWNAQTWTAVGGGLAVGAIEESGDMKGAGFDLILSGVDQTIISALFTQNYRGRAVFVGQAILDQSDGTVIDVIEWAPAGLQLDGYEITENIQRGQPLTSTIRTRVRHRLGEDEYRGIRANMASHQQEHSDDTFFQHVPSIVNKKLYWGTPAPTTIGGGGGFGSGGVGGGGGDGDIDSSYDGSR